MPPRGTVSSGTGSSGTISAGAGAAGTSRAHARPPEICSSVVWPTSAREICSTAPRSLATSAAAACSGPVSGTPLIASTTSPSSRPIAAYTEPSRTPAIW